MLSANLQSIVTQPVELIGPRWRAALRLDDKGRLDARGLRWLRESDERAERVAAIVAGVLPRAIDLGWPASRISGADFWPGESRGLAAVLEPEDRIETVDAEVIAIARPDRRGARRLRFFKSNGGGEFDGPTR